MIKKDNECESGDSKLGTFETMQDCAKACKDKAGCRYFVFGKGKKAGRCYQEYTVDATCTEGWQSDSYDFYDTQFKPPKLAKKGHDCGSQNEFLGTFDTADECAAACATTPGCRFFTFGTGANEGKCYHAQTDSSDCAEGFKPAAYDFYDTSPQIPNPHRWAGLRKSFKKCRNLSGKKAKPVPPKEASTIPLGKGAKCDAGWTAIDGACFAVHQAKDLPGGSGDIDDADQYCMKQHARSRIASITSSDMNEGVAELIGSASQYLIGLRRPAPDQQWAWMDGETVDWMAKRWGKSDNADQPCTRLVGAKHPWHTGGWDDFSCSIGRGSNSGFVCRCASSRRLPLRPDC